VHTELASRDAILLRAREGIAGKDKQVREHCAYLVAYLELRAGVTDAFVEFAGPAAKKADLACGAWRALRMVTGDWRMGRYPQSVTIAPLAAAITAALAPTSKWIVAALEALNDWQFHPPRRTDLTAILAPLLVLRTHPRPWIAEHASRYVDNYEWAIVAGDAPPDPALAAGVAEKASRRAAKVLP
jgi:hypothetical protein